MLNTDKMVDNKLKIAAIRSAELLVDNGLGSWKIKLNRKRSVLAETNHKDKSISFSKYFLIVADREQVEGVTLHEATHALLGPGYGHGAEFVRKCTSISPNADYARRGADVAIRKFILTCPECGLSGSLNTNKERYCGICYKKDKKVKFEVVPNQLKVRMW